MDTISKPGLVLLLAALFFATGCSYSPEEINDEKIIMYFQEKNGSYSDEPNVDADNIISVPIPQSHTSIYVNQNGYMTADEKIAVFDSDNIGDSFNVVNADTNEIVYTGNIDVGDVRTGDFSQVTASGRYYIETDTVGRSYYFNIDDDMYTKLFVGLLDGFYEDDDMIGDDVTSIADAVVGMNCVMYAMQCNGDVFEIQSNIIEELLRMSNDLLLKQENDGSLLEDYETTAVFCGIISMCASEFGKYDSSIDKTYSEAAIKAWEWLGTKDCDTAQKQATRLYAASQLYSRLGYGQYKTVSENYLSQMQSAYSQDAFTFYGAIAYMNSKQTVDIDLCTYIMIDMISDADKICDAASGDKVYAVGVDNIADVMEDTARICFFNYLVPSYEYEEILSSAIGYMGGYNPNGTNYLDEYPQEKEYEYKSVAIFALSYMVDAE